MTISLSLDNNHLAGQQVQHVTSDAAVEDQQDQYKAVMKHQKAHDRSMVGLELFRDPRTGRVTLVSIGHDCLKLWTVIAFDDEFELAQIGQVTKWNCGVQSYAVTEGGKAIYIVGTESTLHHVQLGIPNMDKAPKVQDLQRGLMEIWFVQSTTTPNQFLTVNFQTNQLQILETNGELISAVPFEKARQISAIVYGPKFTVVGNSLGVITASSSSSLQTLYSLEGHSMKVRCLCFLDDENGKLLSASEDKTVKLFALSETRAQLLRVYCGHKGIVTGLAVCRAAGGDRFASCGTDAALIVWDTHAGHPLHTFRDCTGTLNDVPRCVQFTPNGRFLIVGSDEANILAFRVPQPKNYVEEPPFIQIEEEQKMMEEEEQMEREEELAVDEWNGIDGNQRWKADDKEGREEEEVEGGKMNGRREKQTEEDGGTPGMMEEEKDMTRHDDGVEEGGTGEEARTPAEEEGGGDEQGGSGKEMEDDEGEGEGTQQNAEEPPRAEEEPDPEELERRQLEMELGID